MHGNDTKYKTFILPEGYDFRYTLEYLIQRKVLYTNMTLAEVVQDVARIMACTDRMVRNYRKEKINSKRAPLSEERRKELGKYFGVHPMQLITAHVVLSAKEDLLASKADV